MKYPRVSFETPEQTDAVYDHYENYLPPQRRTQMAYAAFRLAFNPDTYFSGNAEQEFAEFAENDTPQLFVFNHLTPWADQFNASSFALNEVYDDVGKTRVLAKDTLFRSKFIPRTFFEVMCAIPVPRRKNYVSEHDDAATQARMHEMLDYAQEKLHDTNINVLAKGQNLASFIEKSHNRGDPTKLQSISSSFADIAIKAAVLRESEIPVTPVGFAMGESHNHLRRNPFSTVAVVSESIIVTPESTVDGIVAATEHNLQEAVTAATLIRRHR
jgi:hypothetical protein